MNHENINAVTNLPDSGTLFIVLKILSGPRLIIEPKAETAQSGTIER